MTEVFVTALDPAYEYRPMTFSSQLFAPYTFFVTKKFPTCCKIKEVIRKGGGVIVSDPTDATPVDYWLVPEYFQGDTRPDAEYFSIVMDAARTGKFPPASKVRKGRDYYCPFAEPKGSGKFTHAEVEFLTGFIQMRGGTSSIRKSDIETLCAVLEYRHTKQSVTSKLQQLQLFPASPVRTRLVTYPSPIREEDDPDE